MATDEQGKKALQALIQMIHHVKLDVRITNDIFKKMFYVAKETSRQSIDAYPPQVTDAMMGQPMNPWQDLILNLNKQKESAFSQVVTYNSQDFPELLDELTTLFTHSDYGLLRDAIKQPHAVKTCTERGT